MQWPDWEGGAATKWGLAFDALRASADAISASREDFVLAMRAAEKAHWERVDRDHWSGPPTGVVSDGFQRLGTSVGDAALVTVLDGYARAVAGWCTVFSDTRDTLATLRERGYRLGLLSNTWWAADWHNADLATHGLATLIDAIAYTSDLPHSKPHHAVFEEVARRLDVEPDECVMVGDRMVDDVSGALEAGMRGVWRKNESGFPSSIAVPSAEITRLSELPELLQRWGGA